LATSGWLFFRDFRRLTLAVKDYLSTVSQAGVACPSLHPIAVVIAERDTR
jgi:hypothetical protein